MRRLKVRVAAQSRFRLVRKGEYEVINNGDTTRYHPLDKTARIEVDNILIGINFHWQQTVKMVLPEEVVVVSHADGTADLFNILDVDTYLKSVISSEMSASAPLEFLKAHAIVSRSWVVGKMLHSHAEESADKVLTANEIITWEDTADHIGFDVCSDDHCQRYQGIGRVTDKVERAVEETSGIILSDADDKVIDARFSKCCGGRTELFSSCWQPEDYPYLPSKTDPYCDPLRLPSAKLGRILDAVLMKYDRQTLDYHDWKATVTADEIRQNMKERHGIDTGRISDILTVERGPSGRITRLKIVAENGEFIVGKELEIRRLLSRKCLYSSSFDIKKESDGVFHLTGKGWGHGVGLCQIGAAVMASEGAGCDEILKFYYPNTNLSRI